MEKTEVLKRVLRILPDEQYIRLLYLAKFKKRLRLRDPKTFNEKLQWLKLHDRDPKYSHTVDKYDAKELVSKILGQEYVIPTYGVWDRFDDVDFDSLPNQFVLKISFILMAFRIRNCIESICIRVKANKFCVTGNNASYDFL